MKTLSYISRLSLLFVTLFTIVGCNKNVTETTKTQYEDTLVKVPSDSMQVTIDEPSIDSITPVESENFEVDILPNKKRDLSDTLNKIEQEHERELKALLKRNNCSEKVADTVLSINRHYSNVVKNLEKDNRQWRIKAKSLERKVKAKTKKITTLREVEKKESFMDKFTKALKWIFFILLTGAVMYFVSKW